MAEAAEGGTVKPATIPKRGGFGKIFMWAIIILGILFILYQFYG